VAELKITDELREKLKGLMPFSQAGVIDYTPAQFLSAGLEADQIPVFTHRCFTQAENLEYREAISTAMGDGKYKIGELLKIQREFDRKVLKGWKNYFDLESGKEIPYGADADGGCDKRAFEYVLDFIASGITENAGQWSGLKPPEAEALKS